MKEKKEVVYYIGNAKDFNKLKYLKSYIMPILVINNDIDFQGIKFDPVDVEKLDVIIKGNNFTFSNLTIDNDRKPNTGLFSKVKSLQVIDLNIVNCNIKGGVNTGSLAGKVDKNVLLYNTSISGIIDCEAYGGIAIGCCDDLTMDKTSIISSVKGYDIVGGVAGMVNSIKSYDNNVKSTVKSVGKAKGDIAGYNSEAESARIAKMAKEAMKNLPPVCTDEEMRILEKMIKKDKR